MITKILKQVDVFLLFLMQQTSKFTRKHLILQFKL
jgi:hypothetical protein